MVFFGFDSFDDLVPERESSTMFSWHTFVMGAILGVVQFGLGLWIGKIVYDRRKQRQACGMAESEQTKVQENTQRLQTVTSRLQSTVHRVSSDVGNHQVRIEQMTRELHTLKNRSVTVAEEVIWERLNQLQRMTTDFCNRLADAESQIQVQAKQIDMVAESQNLFVENKDLTQSDIHRVGDSSDTFCSPEGPESLISDETVDSVVLLGAANDSPSGEAEEVDSMLESVRSRLNEVVSSTTTE